jgi:hypothetical protein
MERQVGVIRESGCPLREIPRHGMSVGNTLTVPRDDGVVVGRWASCSGRALGTGGMHVIRNWRRDESVRLADARGAEVAGRSREPALLLH